MPRFPLLSFVPVLLIAASAAAEDRKVPSTTYPTIGAAVAAAHTGDRILVGPGVYRENVVCDVASVQFVGRGAIWDGTIAAGQSGAALTCHASGIVVQGFTFRAGSGAQVDLTGDDCRVVGCVARGPERFLRATGNRTSVGNCRAIGTDSLGIDLAGDGCVVAKCSFQQCDGIVVRVAGADALVTRCAFRTCENGDMINIVGANARVLGNRFQDADNDVIDVTGNGALVEGNRVDARGGIRVTGDALTIRGNLLTRLESAAIVATSGTPTGGGTIESNSVTDAASRGIDVAASNVVVRRNRVQNAGASGTAGAFRVSGDGNTLEDDVAQGSGTHAFEVTGSGNTLTRCTAVDAISDGFHVTGDNDTLADCRASLCTGEGLDNGGTGTTVTGCTFRKNRIDVVNDGTFTTFAADDRYETGGPSEPPQVD